MEINKEFENCNLKRKQIIYPAYQTTHRFHNLYSDVRTFVRELIQNADDADADSIKFRISLPKEIEVINDGKPFDSNDIERLLTPCLGGKDFDKTGAMNLGALSVLSVSDTPMYHSGKVLLKFKMDHDSEDFVPYINENYNSFFKGTRLILPFHSRLSSDDLKKLDKIEDYLTQYSHLLFTRKLKTINLTYSDKMLELKKSIEDQVLFKSNKIQANIMNVLITKTFSKGKKLRSEENRWIVVKRDIDIPKKYLNQKVLILESEDIKIPIYLAFAIENNLPKRVDYPIYIIFPSDTQFGLGFVLSSNFSPETSRKGFSTEGIDGDFNKFLLSKASELLEVTLTYFKKYLSSFPDARKIEFFNAILETIYYRETYSSLESYTKEYIFRQIVKYLETNVLDQNGNWNKASKMAIADPGLWTFFKNQFKFIDPGSNEDIIKLLKTAGVRELTISDLVENIALGNIRKTQDLFNAWSYLSIHRNKITKQMKTLLLNRKTLPNRGGKLLVPRHLIIPHEEAIGLYSSQKELNSDFIENKPLKDFIINLGVPKLRPKQVLDYFISKKSSFSTKNLELLKKYYIYFHKFGLLDKKRKIIITNDGFKNPDEAFFNRAATKNVFGNNIALIPKKLEASRKCKMYFENLGVSKELTAKYVIAQIRKHGSAIISLEVLKFLSKNVRSLKNSDLKYLEKIELIPTTDGKFVRPNDCYFLNDQNKKILGDLVNYFDPKEDTNKEWLKFFKKIGISKYPKIKHLRLAIEQAINIYKSQEKQNGKIAHELKERIELLLNAIAKNDQKDEKRGFFLELKELAFIPSTKGLKKSTEIYIKQEKIMNLLGESVPYPLINIPEKLFKKLGINENAIPEDVAYHLFNNLIKDKQIFDNNSDIPSLKKRFDKIYAFLGQTDNFNRLNVNTIKKLMNNPIIYLPKYQTFEKASKLIIYSREAEVIYGDKKNLIRYSDYPNSLNFFKRIGVKTSINSDDVAEFLIEYTNHGKVESQRLFMLYNILGQRYRFLSESMRLSLRKSKIVLSDDLKSFEYPDKIFIPDEKSYIERFPSIKVAIINDKIIDFLESVGVKKVSDVILKNIMFTGEIKGAQFSKDLSMKIVELIPYIEIIVKESNISSLDKNWKSRIRKIKCLICEHIFYELQYENKKSKIQGNTVEYDSKKNIIGIIQHINKRNPTKFLMDFSKAIAYSVFIGSVPKAKMFSPIIEKLLFSENKIQTLKELGYSTFKLEAKKFNNPNVKLNLVEEKNQDLIKNSRFYQNLPRISKKKDIKPKSWTPKRFNIIKEATGTNIQKRILNMNKNISVNQEDQINIILKSPPPHNKMTDFIKQQIDNNFNFNQGRISNYYKINNNTKRILKKQRKTMYKSMEFPGRAEFGGVDITPPIPKLKIEKVNGFHYYIQDDLEVNFDVNLLQKFEKMLQFIISMMGGNQETVSVALFNAPIEAFNYKGQILFNYLLMIDEELENKYPLFLIWLMIAAHELAHNICPNHDKLHSKYMMIFTLEALKNLETIKEQYFLLFNKN